MKRIHRLPLFVIALLLGLSVGSAQTSFEPQNLRAINTEYSEINPVISRDGETLFFCRVNHPENRLGEENSQDIWFSTLQEDGTWGNAIRLSNEVNIGRYNAILSALDDGRSYLILGHYNKNGTRWLTSGFSVIEKQNPYQWGKPTPIKVKALKRMNKGKVVNAYMSPDRKQLFMAFTKSPNGKRLSLYVSTHLKENVYTKPKLLKYGSKKTAKAKSMESPYLSADKNRIYFSADYGNEHENLDIFYADRVDDTYQNWSEPVRVTDTINTPNWDSYFKKDANENWAYYSSITNSVGKSDIFSIKIFEDFPFLKLSGLVLNQANQKPMLGKTGCKILVNDEESLEMKINTDSASYEILLPLGVKYTLLPQMENWNGISTEIDLTAVREYTEDSINLYVTSVPWIQLQGLLLDNNSLTPITPEAQAKLLINNQVVDSVQFDPATGAYSVNLSFGETYNLGVVAKNYKTLDNKVDLTGYEEFVVVNQDIFAEREDANMVSLSGKIINTKTGKQLEEGFDVKMRVNNVESRAFTYDEKNATYALKLPIGNNYDLTPSVINFYNRFEAVDLTSAAPLSKIVRNFYVTPIEVGQSVDIENIYFETGKAALKSESFRSLNALVQFLNEYPNVKVEIGGHTDNVGSAVINTRISTERALSVAEYVIAQGISSHRVISKGYAFSKPKASNRTAEGRAQNRRVDFTIIGI